MVLGALIVFTLTEDNKYYSGKDDVDTNTVTPLDPTPGDISKSYPDQCCFWFTTNPQPLEVDMGDWRSLSSHNL